MQIPRVEAIGPVVVHVHDCTAIRSDFAAYQMIWSVAASPFRNTAQKASLHRPHRARALMASIQRYLEWTTHRAYWNFEKHLLVGGITYTLCRHTQYSAVRAVS